MKSKEIQKQVKKITDAMTFIWKKTEKARGHNCEMYYSTYQLLAYAWEYFGRKCQKHKFRFRKKYKRWTCEWCGKVKR